VELTTKVVVPTLAKYEILNQLKVFGIEDLLRISNDLDNYHFLEVPLERRYSENQKRRFFFNAKIQLL